LELVYEKIGQDKFMLAARVFFAFPDEVVLNESQNLISIIQKIAEKDKNAKVIINNLINRNPSKYWSLKQK
jgi:hypothetical protein